MYRSLLLTFLLSCSSTAWSMSVAFVSPGYANEIYWAAVVEAMRKAAQDLDIDLEVHFADRDRLREIGLVKSLVALPKDQRPEYLVIAGEKRTLPEQLRLTEDSGISVFLMANAPTAEDRLQVGLPRQKFKHWLGVLTPAAEQAGYLTAQSLFKQAAQKRLGADGTLYLLAVSGGRSTESSVRRNQGLQEALSEHPQVVLLQMVHADWQKDKAQFQIQHLLKRYPQTQLIWCGNDRMAFGAIQAVQEAGKIPGKDILISGINTSPEALNARISGQLSALAGGHYLGGAWALVVLYDYHHGIDFAQTEGLEMDRPMFDLLSPKQARQLLRVGSIPEDFRVYSKTLNPKIGLYRFQYVLPDGQEHP